MLEKFEQIAVWVDPTPRTGADNMAIDEWLLKTVTDVPRLRFYQWSQPEVSFGYFEKWTVAKQKIQSAGLHYVRRWSGGGVVDHRIDTTYTVVIPHGHEWTRLKGAGSYKQIHQAVVRALSKCGVESHLIVEDSKVDSVACFENPVAYDVVAEDGSKIAGAGQRRTKWGMLHQGSVQRMENSRRWYEFLSQELAENVSLFEPQIPIEVIKKLSSKYKERSWLEAR